MGSLVTIVPVWAINYASSGQRVTERQCAWAIAWVHACQRYIITKVPRWTVLGLHTSESAWGYTEQREWRSRTISNTCAISLSINVSTAITRVHALSPLSVFVIHIRAHCHASVYIVVSVVSIWAWNLAALCEWVCEGGLSAVGGQHTQLFGEISVGIVRT